MRSDLEEIVRFEDAAGGELIESAAEEESKRKQRST